MDRESLVSSIMDQWKTQTYTIFKKKAAASVVLLGSSLSPYDMYRDLFSNTVSSSVNVLTAASSEFLLKKIFASKDSFSSRVIIRMASAAIASSVSNYVFEETRSISGLILRPLYAGYSAAVFYVLTHPIDALRYLEQINPEAYNIIITVISNERTSFEQIISIMDSLHIDSSELRNFIDSINQ